MNQFWPADWWLETASRALTAGAEVTRIGVAEWDVSARCERPIYREIVGRTKPGSKYGSRSRFATDRNTLEMSVRCRKCTPCLKARSFFWRMRVVDELKATQGRTWFLTLTVAPQGHVDAANRARLRLAVQGVDFDRLSPDQQFVERQSEIGPEITRYLKRVRKESGSPLRYALVAEPHKSGLPHYHALIHEVDPYSPVRASTLKGQWKLGFSQCKLVAQGDENRTASYVAKYLTKTASSRVRVSEGYGQADQLNINCKTI